MKIGILTLPLHTNYGGILQAYALQTVLQRMGHEVIVLNRDRDLYRNLGRRMLSLAKYLVYKYLLRRRVKYLSDEQINYERRTREKFTNEFIEKYIHTQTVRKISPNVFDDIDAVIVGSDQVWRPIYFKTLWSRSMGDAFLKFLEGKNIKRIAYAASFGTDEWEYTTDETIECAHLLGMFDAVSVRESSAIGLCKIFFGIKDAHQVLDPTMLLSKEDYVKLVADAQTNKCAGNLMCYILDDTLDKQKLVKEIAEGRGFTQFNASSKIYDSVNSNKRLCMPPLEQWLKSFRDAEFVVTDSFHACVFCIIFAKPFIVIGNKTRGMARFESLLSMFNLEQNLIYTSEDYNSRLTYDVSSKTIDLLDKMRKISYNYLTNALV